MLRNVFIFSTLIFFSVNFHARADCFESADKHQCEVREMLERALEDIRDTANAALELANEVPTPTPEPGPIPEPVPTPDPVPVPEPVPTPDPTPVPIPTPDPTPVNWPTLATTGPLDTNGDLRGQCAEICTSGLSRHDSSIIAQNDSELIQCLDIRGHVNLNGKNDVVLRCNMISSTGSIVVNYSGTALSPRIEDNLIDCGGGASKGLRLVGIGGRSSDNPALISSNEITNCEDGMFLDRDFTYVKDNLIHDLVGQHGPNCAGNDCHSDAIHFNAGDGSVIENNVLDARAQPGTGTSNASFFMATRRANMGPLFRHNLLAGGTFSMYHIAKGTAPCSVGTRVLDNVFIFNSWMYGPVMFRENGKTCRPSEFEGEWGGNTFDTGEVVSE